MQMTEPDNVVRCKKISGKPYYYSNLNTTVKSSILADLSTENDSRENGPKALARILKLRDGWTASVTAVACDNQRESARPVSAGVYTVPLGAICFPHSPHSSTTTTMSITKIYARQESFFLSVPVAITCP